MIDAGVDINWLDIIKPENRIGGADHPWENNEDDGWYHVDLPFDFNWFGKIERRITVGTNGTPLNFTLASQFCPLKVYPQVLLLLAMPNFLMATRNRYHANGLRAPGREPAKVAVFKTVKTVRRLPPVGTMVLKSTALLRLSGVI